MDDLLLRARLVLHHVPRAFGDSNRDVQIRVSRQRARVRGSHAQRARDLRFRVRADSHQRERHRQDDARATPRARRRRHGVVDR